MAYTSHFHLVSNKGLHKIYTTWKVSKYGGFSGPYFPIFSPNTGKYGPEKPPYSDTFNEVIVNFAECVGIENCFINKTF